jgi:hypothetical protein
MSVNARSRDRITKTSHNPAGQACPRIASRTQSNDAVYSWTGVSANRANSIDGLDPGSSPGHHQRQRQQLRL